MRYHFSSLSKTSGFSLIELMIVIAIIGILAVFAIPSYMNYAKRARFTEVIISTEPYKIALSLALQEGLSPDKLKLGSDGIPDAPRTGNRNLASISLDAGAIKAVATDELDNAEYIIKPREDGGSIIWELDKESSCIAKKLC